MLTNYLCVFCWTFAPAPRALPVAILRVASEPSHCSNLVASPAIVGVGDFAEKTPSASGYIPFAEILQKRGGGNLPGQSIAEPKYFAA